MSNSYASYVQGLYSAIFRDIRAALPSVGGLERDEHRLLSTIETRGLRFATLDLPSYGKHFDKCLADGLLTPSSIPNFGMRSRRVRSHVFLRGLTSRVFDSNGVLLSQPCILSISFLRQLFYAVKKIKIECTEKVRERTLQRYIDQERSLRPPSLNWHGDRLDHRDGVRHHIDDFRRQRGRDQQDLFEDQLVSARFCDTVHDVADRVFSSFGEFNPEEWRPKHGPGAVADRPLGGYKYNFPTWSSRLESVFPSSLFANANYDAWVYSLTHGTAPLECEVPSHVLTVPKSQKAPRIIAKEPTANMWCQQLVWNYFETKVNDSFLGKVIHFRDQSFNQEAALRASHTGTHWTVDLSDASDRVSLWLVERLVRSNRTLLDALHACRSQYSTVPTRDGNVLLKLKKYAPQGSATTFPLQSIIYAVIALSSVLYARNLKVTTRNLVAVAREVLVFGDDTIIPSDAGEHYVSMLTYLGFFVNYDKTYKNGKFRESCGCEGYDGVDVTPAYFVTPFSESSPTSISSTVECSNNFYMKLMWHTAAWIESTLPFWVKNSLQIRVVDDGRFGLTSFCGSRRNGRIRYNENLQREEVLSVSVTMRQNRVQPGGPGHLLQYYTEAPANDIHWMSGVDGRSVSSARRRWESIT